MTKKKDKRRRKKIHSAATIAKIAETLANKKAETLTKVLARIPRSKDWLNTADLVKIFKVHEGTIYKWVRLKKIKAYGSQARGKANLYKKAEVAALIHSQFEPQPK